MQTVGWEQILRVARGIDDGGEPPAHAALTLAKLVIAFHREVVCRPIESIRTKGLLLPGLSSGPTARTGEKDAA